ncbi:MAG: glycosyltransferase family 4 protein [Nitrospirae bacterium]|nr:glycosyltransferase family 4 protein [Nitrospirota bacterium]
MNILFVNHSSSLTGATISCYHLMMGLKNDFVPVFATREYGPIIENLNKSGINTYIIEKKGFLGFHYILSFLKILKKHNVTLIHLNTLTPFCKYAAIAGYLCRIPIVWVVRENPLISRSRRLRFWLTSLASKIIFVDRDTKEKLFQNSRHNVDVIYNGVDINVFKPAESNFLFEKFNIESDKQLIGYIGLITKRKGIEYLIRAFGLIKEKTDNIKLIIIGEYKKSDESYFEEIKTIIKELSLENEVYFTGLLTDVRDALCSLDLVILPSLEERCSRSLLESLACAKAVIATKVGGNPEIVEDGVNGILVEPENEKQIAQAIIKLISNHELRRKMGENGRLKAVDKFNMEKHIQKMKNVFLEVLS